MCRTLQSQLAMGYFKRAMVAGGRKSLGVNVSVTVLGGRRGLTSAGSLKSWLPRASAWLRGASEDSGGRPCRKGTESRDGSRRGQPDRP